MASVWSGRLGLLFAALAGAGAASVVSSGLRALPGVAAVAADHPNLLIFAPLPVGALVAIGHIFWLRGLLARRPVQRNTLPSAAPRQSAVAPAGSLRAQVEAAKAVEGEAPPRWVPEERN
ncbi:hypothetical protein GE253_01450 [Niveispirillum sp. SYP-B3756]|uniref:hypothetical protein n=1 Tax=Niveispirillum sp. SYP-B3756 TaxID=2662178 RepID=UPI001292442E|nr:hypothetical protein [Niveispirillum sp. SYP-B3756]MQP64003.1 hypothetical protein [Niveispirillum sp. SYP-B3756]